MTQSLIIYRNPMEKALWEALTDAQAVPVIAGCFVGFLVFLLVFDVITKGRGYSRDRWPTLVSGIAGLLAGAGVCRWFWL